MTPLPPQPQSPIEPRFHVTSKHLLAALVLMTLVTTPLHAEDVFVVAYTGTTYTADPPFAYGPGISEFGTSSVGSAYPMPPTRTRAMHGYQLGTNAWVTTQPTFSCGAPPGISCKMYVLRGTDDNASPDVIVNISSADGSAELLDPNGNLVNTIASTAFQAGSGAVNNWLFVGSLTNLTTASPKILWAYASGTQGSTGGRCYFDAFRFNMIWGCSDIPPLAVPGPLVAGQTSVLVTNVVAGASDVTVYANGSLIGSTNYAPGFAAGQLTVPTSPLVAGSTIYAQQVRYCCWSMISFPFPIVQALLITTPYTGATALWGRDADLSVTALGAEPIGYQWFKDGALLGAATGCTCSLPAVQFDDAGYYSVVVSNEWKSLTNSGQLVVKTAELDLHLDPGMVAGISITGTAGYAYSMQSTTNLSQPDAWITLTNLTLEQPVQLWQDTSAAAATNSTRFYRVLPAP